MFDITLWCIKKPVRQFIRYLFFISGLILAGTCPNVVWGQDNKIKLVDSLLYNITASDEFSVAVLITDSHGILLS